MNTKEQKKYIFNWLNEICGERDIIRLNEEGKAEYFKFDFPLKSGDKPKKIKKPPSGEAVSFNVIFSPNFEKSSKVINDKWNIIFFSPFVCVLENKKRIESGCFEGKKISKEERVLCLKITRKALEEFLISKKIPDENQFNIYLNKNLLLFSSSFDFSISLWVSGILRGSVVGENKKLISGLTEVSISAARSRHFKPLNLGDLSNTRIEIALFSKLRIPLNKNEIKKNEIYFGKGYLIENKDKREFIFPGIFIKEKIYSLDKLIERNCKMAKEEIKDKKTKIFIFEINDFIESKNRDNVLDIEGTIVSGKGDSKAGMKKCFSSAAKWLMANQEEDGNLPPIVNPLDINKDRNNIDWPRSALNGWSLIEFGKTTNDNDCIQAGKKNFRYLEKYLLNENVLLKSGFHQIVLTLAYLGQSALSLGESAKARECGKIVAEKIRDLEFESILFQQIGSFFIEFSKTDKNFWLPGIKIANIAGDYFERHKNQMNLAFTAELVNLYLKIFQISGSREYLLKAKKIADWLLGYQLISGEFRAMSDLIFPATRGTGKIAEALSTIVAMENDKEIRRVFNVEFIRKRIEKSFDWIRKMQYDDENAYFIPKTNLNYSLGGIRHDYFNVEMWGDSAGHLLLAGSRFLSKK
jgi:AMMECR1 domain-containing protein